MIVFSIHSTTTTTTTTFNPAIASKLSATTSEFKKDTPTASFIFSLYSAFDYKVDHAKCTPKTAMEWCPNVMNLMQMRGFVKTLQSFLSRTYKRTILYPIAQLGRVLDLLNATAHSQSLDFSPSSRSAPLYNAKTRFWAPPTAPQSFVASLTSNTVVRKLLPYIPTAFVIVPCKLLRPFNLLTRPATTTYPTRSQESAYWASAAAGQRELAHSDARFVGSTRPKDRRVPVEDSLPLVRYYVPALLPDYRDADGKLGMEREIEIEKHRESQKKKRNEKRRVTRRVR